MSSFLFAGLACHFDTMGLAEDVASRNERDGSSDSGDGDEASLDTASSTGLAPATTEGSGGSDEGGARGNSGTGGRSPTPEPGTDEDPGLAPTTNPGIVEPTDDPAPCSSEDPQTHLIFARDAELDAMVLGEDPDLPPFDGRPVPYAEQNLEASASGRVTFSFQLRCDTGDVFYWGLVFDALRRDAGNNPDSFFHELDQGPTGLWTYGCEGDNDGWQWERIHLQVEDCDFDPFGGPLSAGEHRLVLVDREHGDATDPPARVAAIAVTTDPGFDPTAIYPTP